MPTIRTLTKITLAAAAVVPVCLAYAYFIEARRLVVNQYELRIDKWNPAFDGFRVALISDIHAGSYDVTPEKLREIVRITNEQDVDAIFMLGDYVSQKRENGVRGLRMQPEVIADNLAGLRSQYGIFLVLGNHDEWYDAPGIIGEFERVGYDVLDGELAEIRLNNGEKLRILGLKDHTTMRIWKEYSDAAKRLLEPTTGQGDLIVLQHSPDALPAVTGDLRISPDTTLLFAGHTHGGQVRIPLIGAPVVPSMFGQRFVSGHARESGIDVFVTTGIGTSILPFRFLVPPEIAVVTIRSGEKE